MNEWGFYPLEENQWQHFAAGQFDWWVRYSPGIWAHVAEKRAEVADSEVPSGEELLPNEKSAELTEPRDDGREGAGDEATAVETRAQELTSPPIPPADVAPTRHVTAAKTHPIGVELVPRCPDRPILLKCSAPISFSSGSTVDLHFAVPLWWSVQTSDGEELYQAPIEQLSQSWFGDSARGTLCYTLFTDPDPAVVPVCTDPPRAACTLRVRNSSTAVYKSDRFLIPADQLRVYGWRDLTCAVAASSILTVVSTASDVHVTVLNGEPKGRIHPGEDGSAAYRGPDTSHATRTARNGQRTGSTGQRSERRKAESPWRQLSEARVAPSEAWWKWGVNLLHRISNY